MQWKIEKSWHACLEKELTKPYVQQLKGFLEKEIKNRQIFPPEKEIFSAFRMTPFSSVKVIILGQDPYHGFGQAHGLCFSVKRGVSVPPSLKNIYKELQQDLGIPPPQHGDLSSWAKQGVLLLNSTLTVESGKPQSHAARGWEQFTDAVIHSLCQKKEPLVFLLWGRSAKEKAKILWETKHKHKVLTAAHPSPFSAKNFLGCRHFSQTNTFLKEWGKEPICWNLPQ